MSHSLLMTPDPYSGKATAPSAEPAANRRVDFSRRGTGRPTMAAVAALAGVSLKTVSRVVNGETPVNPDTAQRVNAASEALGYRRNDAASALARAQPQAGIGLIIEDISDSFYSNLTRGVEEVARAHGHLVLLSSSEENSERERDTTLALAARGVAGMIVVPHSDDHRYLARQINAGLHVVFVDRPPAQLTADCVLSDNIQGARHACTICSTKDINESGSSATIPASTPAPDVFAATARRTPTPTFPSTINSSCSAHALKPKPAKRFNDCLPRQTRRPRYSPRTTS